MRFVWGIIFVCVLVALLALWVVVSGMVDVSAATGKGGFLDWILAETQEHSVESRSSRIPEPDLAQASVPLGAFHYREMCVVCHGGPGVPRSEIGQGLNPSPPDLSNPGLKLKPKELYWIVKNGIRMTGMPSFGATHDEDELRAMAAFALRLPGMSPQEFQALAAAGGSAGEHEHGGPATEGQEGHEEHEQGGQP